jgi:Protein of unknown function (DUF4232)
MSPRRSSSLLLVWALGLAVLGTALCGCSSSPSAGTTTSPSTPPTSTPPSTSPPTSDTVAPTSSTTTTTTGMPTCPASALTVKRGGGSGAAGTVAMGFVISNTSATECTLAGFPALSLVPATSARHALIEDFGSAHLVNLAGGGTGGFVLEYSDVPVDGQTNCPTLTGVDVRLPQVSGPAVMVRARFSPCGRPDIRVSAVLSSSHYDAMLG